MNADRVKNYCRALIRQKKGYKKTQFLNKRYLLITILCYIYIPGSLIMLTKYTTNIKYLLKFFK